MFAHVVAQKGDDAENCCAKLALSDIEWRGRTRVIIKIDNKKSIVSLKVRVAKHLREYKAMTSVQAESPTAYNSVSRRH